MDPDTETEAYPAPMPPEAPDAFTRNAQAAGSGPHTTGEALAYSKRVDAAFSDPHTTGEAPAHSMQYLDSASGPHITGGASTPASP